MALEIGSESVAVLLPLTSPLTNFLYASFTADSSSFAMLTPTIEVRSLLIAASSVSLERTLLRITEISFSIVLILSSF